MTKLADKPARAKSVLVKGKKGSVDVVDLLIAYGTHIMAAEIMLNEIAPKGKSFKQYLAIAKQIASGLGSAMTTKKKAKKR